MNDLPLNLVASSPAAVVGPPDSDRPLNLLHVYAGNLYGGIETVLATMARSQSDTPWLRHHFALCFTGRLSRELESLSAPVHLLGDVRFSRPWTAWRARRRLRSLLQSQPFDAVVCHSSWPHALFAPVVRRLSLPLVYWAHDAVRRPGWIDRLASLSPPSLLISNSLYTSTFASLLFPAAPVEVVRYPVIDTRLNDAVEVRARIRNTFGASCEETVLVQVSRMDSWKGHHILLRSLANLHTSRPWKCWIVGGAQRPAEVEYLSQLKDLVKHLELESVVLFIGERRDVPQVLSAADVLCQANEQPEPFGVTFIEAMYAGLPVATTDMGGPAEYISPAFGRLVPPRDPAAFAKVLDELIDSPELRRSLGSAAPAAAAALCSPSQTMRQLHAALRKHVFTSKSRR